MLIEEEKAWPLPLSINGNNSIVEELQKSPTPETATINSEAEMTNKQDSTYSKSILPQPQPQPLQSITNYPPAAPCSTPTIPTCTTTEIA